MDYNVRQDLLFIREILGYSQEQMARQIGLSRETIKRIENYGYKPSFDTINKIYDYAFKKNIKINSLKEYFYFEEAKSSEKILFHGTKSEIKGEISPFVSRDNLDFGKGFYCGTSYEQTVSFVSRFPDSSIYILSFSHTNLTHVTFNVDQEWMLSIAYFRGRLKGYEDKLIIKKILNKIKEADYIIAPIADNRMFRIIDRFIDGEITDEQCKHCLAATNLGCQYVLLNEKATKSIKILDRCFISLLEREKCDEIRKNDVNDGDNKVKAALIKYKNEGKYIEEILK